LKAPASYALAAAACLIFALQAGVSRALKVDEAKIGIPMLHDIPMQIGEWTSSGEGYMDAGTAAYLKPDEYILRDYIDAQHSTQINLFVAYFKSLQNSYGPHSPRICLPGSGWLVSSSNVSKIDIPGRTVPIPANEFTMEKGNQHILVLYWYQNDRDVWAEEFHAKLRLLPDLIRYRRSDVSLVRLVMPIDGTSQDRGVKLSVEFARQLFPELATHFASVTSGG
jgi:EpsI family protein